MVLCSAVLCCSVVACAALATVVWPGNNDISEIPELTGTTLALTHIATRNEMVRPVYEM